MSEGPVTVTVKASSGQKFTVEISQEDKIEQLKEKIAVESNIPASDQRLIYSGRILKDPETVKSYGR